MPLDIERYRHAVPFRDLLNEFGHSVNGKRSHIPCFVHGDRNPSMKVYDDHCYCFSCGARFDSIDLVQHERSCGFWESLEWISQQAGLPMPKRDPHAQKVYESRKTVSEVYAGIFRDSLEQAEIGIKYLEDRGISSSVSEGLVGYLPRDYEPANRAEAEKAGLYSKAGNFLFSDRAVIPIIHSGSLVSLYGRTIRTEDPRPKHIYPAKTEPPMPAALWGLHEVKGEQAFLCESIIDAMTLRAHGFPAIAAFGTQGLTSDRVELLKGSRLKKITFCFDSETNGAGHRGALEAGEKLFRAGLDVEIVNLPLDGKEKADPNIYFQEHTAEDFRALERRVFFDARLDAVPSNGSPRDLYRALVPVLELIAEQPELLWKEYANRIHSRFSRLDKRKIEKEITDRRQGAEKINEARKKFLPLSYVEKLMEEAPVICFDGRAFRYEYGVYSLWPPEEIDQKTIEMIGPEVQGNQLDAVRKFLMSVAFVRSEKVNPRGILNLKNGLLDIETGIMQGHTPEVLSVVQSETAFIPEATCPLWLQTIEEIIPDPNTRTLLAQIYGYCLTPDNSFHRGFIFFGQGANGKSVVTDVLLALLGWQNCSALHLNDFKDKFRLAGLADKLVNFSTEVEARGLVADSMIKAIISGDPLTAEHKNLPAFTFRPFVKLIVSCNRLPATSDKSHGYFRRWCVMPFTQTFDRDKRDKRRAERIIREELSGVLNWAIAGLARLKADGCFIEPEQCTEALNEYRKQTDHTLEFVEDALRILPSDNGGSSLLQIFQAYDSWIRSNNYQPLGRNNFYRDLERATGREKKKDKDSGATFIPGVYLSPEE